MLYLTEITNCYLTRKYLPKRMKMPKVREVRRARRTHIGAHCIWWRGSQDHSKKCMKEGLVIPSSKRQGKDPLLVNSYRRIIYSLLCVVTDSLNYPSAAIGKQVFPDQLQTTY